MKPLWFMPLVVAGCGGETAAAGDLDAPIAASPGAHAVSCNSWDAAGHVYTSAARAFTVVACGAPAILSPAGAETIAGDALRVETSAPACLGTTKCYLDGNPTPVTVGTGNLVADVPVGAGTHGIACNGWDANGKVYVSATTTFVANGGTACPASVTGASITAHNTSASPHYDRAHFGANFGTATWISQGGATQAVDPAREDLSNNPITPGHVSGVDVHRLVPSRPDLRWFAHVVPWFRAGGGGHVDIGVDNTSSAWIAALLQDLHRRGFDGVVIDWYGQGSYTDQATLAMQAYLHAHPELGLTLIVMIDKGVANLSQSVLAAQIQYVKTQYMSDALYERDGGKPILMFFGVLDKLGATAMATVKAQVGGGQSWVLQGTGVLSYAWVDQAFDWAAPYHDGLHPSDPYNLAALSGFYAKLASTPAKRGFGALAPGFNGMLTASVAWSKGKYLPRGNGACLVQRAARTDAVIPPNVTRMQVVTWNDWEEGSQVETGVETDLAVQASVGGGALAWTPGGDESTVDHYDVYVSGDGGATAHRIGTAPRGARSFPLANTCVAHGASARAAVVAVGRPLLRDHASSWLAW